MAIRLNHREKYAVFTMMLFCVLFVVFQFVVFPMLDKRKRLDRAIQVKTRTLADMVQLQREYREIIDQTRSIRERYAEREKGFALFTFLDRLAGQAGVKDKITLMKPSTTASNAGDYKTSLVEMKIEGVTLNRLVPYLQMIETSRNVVRVRRLSLSKADKDEGLINAILQIETLET